MPASIALMTPRESISPATETPTWGPKGKPWNRLDGNVQETARLQGVCGQYRTSDSAPDATAFERLIAVLPGGYGGYVELPLAVAFRAARWLVASGECPYGDVSINGQVPLRVTMID